MRADKRRTLLANPALFIVTYFPHRISRLEPFHTRLIATSTTDVRSLTEYPAGHGKTTIVATLLPIWAVCCDPDVRIGLIFKNTTEGEGVIRAIQAEMTDNTALIRDFGPFKPTTEGRAWSLSRMDVERRSRRGKESTISMFGAASKDVLGHRTDWTICDDVINDVNSATPEARQKMRDWFDMCVETGPEHPHSRLTVVGTRFHPQDLYGDLEELAMPSDDGQTLEPLYKTYREDAIVDEAERTTLWPARWPYKRLMQQKVKVGTLSFNKRYRNIAVDESRIVFREQHVNGGFIGKDLFPGCLDKTHSVGDYEVSWRRAAGFDPALGSSKHAKFCAHVVLARGTCKEHETCYWLLDVERDQWSLPQQVDLLLAKHAEYGLLTTQIETNGYQSGLVEAIDHKMRQIDVAYKMEGHYTSKFNKPDPELGVTSMAPWFERGAVHIPWADAHSQRKMRPFIDELVMYPSGRTTDTVMAFWFAYRALELAAPPFGGFNRLERDAPSLHRRAGKRVVLNPAYAQRG